MEEYLQALQAFLKRGTRSLEFKDRVLGFVVWGMVCSSGSCEIRVSSLRLGVWDLWFGV